MRMLDDPRRRRQVLNWTAGVALVSVGWAAAGLVWRMAGHPDSGAVTVPSSARVRGTSTDLGPALALSPFGKAAPGENAVATTLQAVLRGIVFVRPEALSTAFVAIGAEPAKPVRIGETVAGATVTEIRRDRILLSNAGRVEYLAMPDPFGRPPAPAGSVAPVGAPAAPALPTPGLVPTTNPAQALIGRLGATQVAGGFAIGGSPPPGLRSGDVIQSVNGTALTDQASANAALAGAAQGGTAQVTILRDGRPITATIPLR